MDEKEKTITLDEIRTGFDENSIKKAEEILKKYKEGKTNLESRVIKNDKWYKMRVEPEEKADSKSTSKKTAWLFNSLANKHADMLDNFPEINVLPREKSDEQAAEVLGQILPVVFERCNFEKTYSDVAWEKIKNGTGIYGVFWNPTLNGIGDIDIREIDILSLFWEPGIKDIQESQNVFYVKLENNDVLESTYPDKLEGKLGANGLQIAQYHNDDTIDNSDKTPVVDWYYKRKTENGEVLHYCKYCNDVCLYASENDPNYAERGFYDHGKYPFVFDVCFPIKDSPCGFGYVDIMSDSQDTIDGLTNAVVQNAERGTKPRYFINSAGAVNEEEFADWSNSFVHVSGSNLGDDSIREIKAPALDANYLTILEMQQNELKEISGNRDFSQGSTVSGVTAASAIAALQEAGGKLTRDMVKGGYNAFREINEFAVELIRQFYETNRSFRIVGPNEKASFVTFNNKDVKVQKVQMMGTEALSSRLPVFDIKVVPSKNSAYSRLSQNELALQLYNAGMFNPENADRATATVTMMNFTGKQQALETIKKNGSMYEAIQALAPLALEYARAVDTQQNNGGQMTQKIALILQNLQGSSQPLSVNIEPVDNSPEAKARRRTNEATTPK